MFTKRISMREKQTSSCGPRFCKCQRLNQSNITKLYIEFIHCNVPELKMKRLRGSTSNSPKRPVVTALAKLFVALTPRSSSVMSPLKVKLNNTITLPRLKNETNVKVCSHPDLKNFIYKIYFNVNAVISAN